jgi:hypothetical protein
MPNIRRYILTLAEAVEPPHQVLNPDDIATYCEGWAGRVRHPEAKRWFRVRLLRYIQNSPRYLDRYDPRYMKEYLNRASPSVRPHLDALLASGQELYFFAPEPWTFYDDEDADPNDDCRVLGRELNDVVQWLDAQPDTWHVWPKLYQRVSVPQAVEAAEAWLDLKARRAALADPENGCETVLPLGTWRWVRLRTADAVKRDGYMMKNCLRNPDQSYGEQVEDGTSFIYSLRDAQNRPHVMVTTYPVWANKVPEGVREMLDSNEIYGVANSDLKPAYVEMTVRLLNHIRAWSNYTPTNLPGVAYRDGRYGLADAAGN